MERNLKQPRPGKRSYLVWVRAWLIINKATCRWLDLLEFSHGHQFVGQVKRAPVQQPKKKRKEIQWMPSVPAAYFILTDMPRDHFPLIKNSHIINCLWIILWGMIQNKQNSNRRRSNSLEAFQSLGMAEGSRRHLCGGSDCAISSRLRSLRVSVVTCNLHSSGWQEGGKYFWRILRIFLLSPEGFFKTLLSL